MQRHLRTAAAPFLLLVGVSCSGDLQTTPGTGQGNVSTEPSIVSLAVSPDTIRLRIGDNLMLSANFVLSNGARVRAMVEWRSSNSNIVSLNPANGYLAGISPGQTVISAAAGGRVAFAPVTVLG